MHRSFKVGLGIFWEDGYLRMLCNVYLIRIRMEILLVVQMVLEALFVIECRSFPSTTVSSIRLTRNRNQTTEANGFINAFLHSRPICRSQDYTSIDLFNKNKNCLATKSQKQQFYRKCSETPSRTIPSTITVTVPPAPNQ